MADAAPTGLARRIVGSIRFRITAVATLAVAGVLTAAAVGLVLAERRLLTADLESALRQRAVALAAELTTGDAIDPLPDGGDETFSQVVAPDGAVLVASPNIAGGPPLAAPLGDDAEAVRQVHEDRVDDDPFLLLSRTVGTPDGPAVVHVAGSLDDVQDATQVLVRALALTIPVVTALLAALVWWLVGRTLRPVEAIRAEVSHMGGGDLSRRVPVPGSDDEIARLSRTMNEMLDRVEDATARQQHFVADASHELRGPLTRIRTELEVDLAHPESADPVATQRSFLAEAIGLQRLVDDLLHLARSDAGAAGGRREPVDLDDIVLREARRLREDARVGVLATSVSAAQVEGDPDQLARVVRNLADNAARHASTTVTFGLVEHDDRAVLTVADDGPGIPPDQQDRVFERFTRLDGARTAGAGGTGLGLAIAREIVERHGGTITIDPAHGDGTRVVVRLPLRSATR